MALHEWFFQARTFKQMCTQSDLTGCKGDGPSAVDDDFAARGFDGIGA